MKITLTITKGEFAGKSFNVDKKAVVGRSPKSQIFIDDELVSRKHAEIYVKDSVVLIKDLKSSGGTFVNSQAILEPRKLKSRDKIRIANTIFEIKILKPKKTKEKTNFASPKLGRTLSDIVRSDTEQIEITDILSASEKEDEKTASKPAYTRDVSKRNQESTSPVDSVENLNQQDWAEKHAAPEPSKVDVYKSSRDAERIQEQAIEVVTKYRGIKRTKQAGKPAFTHDAGSRTQGLYALFTVLKKNARLHASMSFDEMSIGVKSLFVIGIVFFAIMLIYLGFIIFDTETPEIPKSDNKPIFIPDSNQKIHWPVNTGYLSGLHKSPFYPHNLIQTFTECFIVDYEKAGNIIVKGNIELRNSKKLVVFPGAVITNAYEGADIIEVKDFNGDVCTLSYGITIVVSDFGVFEPIADNSENVNDMMADYEKKVEELETNAEVPEDDSEPK